MTTHWLYFRLHGADRFAAIHGAAIVDVAGADMSRRFGVLSRDLLRQHHVLSDPQSPAFGTWLAPFELVRLEIDAGEAEQLESIVRAGRELARTIVEEELGSAVALYARLEVGTLETPGTPSDLPAWEDRLGSLSETVKPLTAGEAVAERKELHRIIAHRVDIMLQAIVSLETRDPVAFEALARGPSGGPWREPDRLFDAAARCGVRPELELNCLDSAVALVRRLPDSCRLAINLSPDLFSAPAVQLLAEVPGLPERLILEITEHLPIPAPARLLEEMRVFSRNGAKIALDDAGCGFLNMDLVRALKPDIVKLCITVTRRIGKGRAILEEIRKTVSAIRAEGAEVLAEGVEDETQARLARECGCSLAQGFYFAKPRTLAEILAAAAVKPEHAVR